MLSFKLTTGKGELCLPPPVRIVYNSEFSVPADDISVEIPYIDGCDDGDFLYGYDGERLVFKGQADEIITQKSGEKTTVKITARSMAGLLLDNEAEPCIYFNASSSVIFERHLKPFGFTEYTGDNEPYFGYVTVGKGMSEWQVLENYCVNKYGKKPRITGDGRVILNGCTNGETLCFGCTEKYGYTSLKRTVKRYNTISEVRLRIEQGNRYGSVIKNPLADKRLVKRRYDDALTGGGSVGTADRIIKNSNSNAFEAVVECPYRLMCEVGSGAVINDEIQGRLDGLYVHKLRYFSDGGGEKTVITLRKEI